MTEILRRLGGMYSVKTETDCWEWEAAKSPNGYGQVKHDGRTRSAHRTVYEQLVGPIPDGLDLDHLCRNRGCVNPDHLEPVTRRENLLRGDTLAASNAAKTRCLRDHPLHGANLYIYPSNGRRACRICRKSARRAGVSR